MSGSAGRPVGSPGCFTHGVTALPPGNGDSVDVPVVSGRVMTSVPAFRSVGGGQSFESLKNLFVVAASATFTAPSTEHGLPTAGPLLHTPVSQRGQTFVSSVRKTSESSWIVFVISPVWRFAVPA